MSPLTNKYWTDTSLLPSDILSLRGDEFFQVIKDLTSDTVAELVRIQAIENVRVFMLVPNILDVFKINSYQLDNLKCKACIQLKNNEYFIKPGVEISIRFLRDLFTTKIQEYYRLNNNDTSTSSDDNNVPSTLKRPTSFSEQISNKRGRH